MREIKDITTDEIKRVNEILKDEYYYSDSLNTASDIEYQCFKKSHAIYSGVGVIKVYEYLKSVGINISCGVIEMENEYCSLMQGKIINYLIKAAPSKMSSLSRILLPNGLIEVCALDHVPRYSIMELNAMLKIEYDTQDAIMLADVVILKAIKGELDIRPFAKDRMKCTVNAT